MSSQQVGSLDRSSCFTYLLFFILVTNILVNFKYLAALPFEAQLRNKLSFSQSLIHLLKTNQISNRFAVVEFDTRDTGTITELRTGKDDKRVSSGEQASTVSNSNSETVAGADFHARCNSPGVIRCVGFDSPSEI